MLHNYKLIWKPEHDIRKARFYSPDRKIIEACDQINAIRAHLGLPEGYIDRLTFNALGEGHNTDHAWRKFLELQPVSR